MIIHKTAVRNGEIFAAYRKGELIEDLARRYGLEAKTIHQIIRIEKHKLAVSVDGFYEEMRSQQLPMPQGSASDAAPAPPQAETAFKKGPNKEPQP